MISLVHYFRFLFFSDRLFISLSLSSPVNRCWCQNECRISIVFKLKSSFSTVWSWRGKLTDTFECLFKLVVQSNKRINCCFAKRPRLVGTQRFRVTLIFSAVSLYFSYVLKYRVCHRFRLTKRKDYFQVTFEASSIFWGSRDREAKTGLSLKPNHHNQVWQS